MRPPLGAPPLFAAGAKKEQDRRRLFRWQHVNLRCENTRERKRTMKKIPSKDGTAIAFDQSGEGPAVILVGGAFQHRAIDPKTTKLTALLAQHFTVFHYDRRGRGDSGDTLPYAIEREIEDLEALIKEAAGSACVFGMSSGAVLTLHAAARGLAFH